MKKGYIYFFKINESNIYKIGITNNLKNRINTHEKYCIGLKILKTRKLIHYEYLEKQIIKKYKQYQHSKNEWFLIKDSKIEKQIIQDIKNFNDNDKSLKNIKSIKYNFFNKEKNYKEKINKLNQFGQILENNIIGQISNKDKTFLINEGLILKINKYFYFNINNNSLIEIFQNNKNYIFSIIGKNQFNNNYTMGYKYSLYYYLNNLNNIKFNEISMLVERKKCKIILNNIGNIKCKYKKSIFGKFINKDQINILTQNELFTYLFGRKIFNNGEYSELEYKNFLINFKSNNFQYLINFFNGGSYNFHILKNAFSIYQKYNIINSELYNLFNFFKFL